MSWQGEMTTIVRTLISDVDSTNYTYSDNRLQPSLFDSQQIVPLIPPTPQQV